MTQIQLRISNDPGSIETFVKMKRADGGYEWMYAIVDTGAEQSLLPVHLMESVAYRLSDSPEIKIEQAGIAKQTFKGTEAYVTLLFEDTTGTQSAEYEVRVWFAGVLDRAVLHVDMPNQTGYLEFST